MNSDNRARALRMLKALVRAIVEELEYDGKAVDATDVAERAMCGYRDTPENASDRAAIRRELEEHIRERMAGASAR